jgi:hypothetical protein
MTSEDSRNENARREQRAGSARTVLMVAGPFAAAGIALCTIGDAELGRWLVLLGGLGLIVGLHRYGRLGADPPLELE